MSVSQTIDTTLEKFETRANALGDRFEESVPAPAKRLVSRGQAMSAASWKATGWFWHQVGSAVDGVTGTISTVTKRTTGQARSAAEHTSEAASRGAKEVAGQAKAAGRQTVAASKVAVENVAKAADDATASVLRSGLEDKDDYKSWTKEELYERAQALDIDGRSHMSKAQLIKALTTV